METNAILVDNTWLTCPYCGFRERLDIPADACDCCVFCSYGDARCLPEQRAAIAAENL